VCELADLAGGHAEQRSVVVVGDAGDGNIFIEVFFQIVVARDLMLLAAFFVQAHPAALALHETISRLHPGQQFRRVGPKVRPRRISPSAYSPPWFSWPVRPAAPWRL
jgi:hypothetical protein